jgi:hypothetical protein
MVFFGGTLMVVVDSIVVWTDHIAWRKTPEEIKAEATYKKHEDIFKTYRERLDLIDETVEHIEDVHVDAYKDIREKHFGGRYGKKARAKLNTAEGRKEVGDDLVKFLMEKAMAKYKSTSDDPFVKESIFNAMYKASTKTFYNIIETQKDEFGPQVYRTIVAQNLIPQVRKSLDDIIDAEIETEHGDSFIKYAKAGDFIKKGKLVMPDKIVRHLRDLHENDGELERSKVKDESYYQPPPPSPPTEEQQAA